MLTVLIVAPKAPHAWAESAPSLCNGNTTKFIPWAPLPHTTPSTTVGALVRLPTIVPMRTIDDIMIEIRDSAGELVPHTAVPVEDGWHLLKPAQPFREGRIAISYFELCDTTAPRDRKTYEFTVAGSTPLPTSVGPAHAEPAFAEPYYVGKCQGPYEVQVPIVLDGPPELLAHLEMARFEVDFGGRTIQVPYGSDRILAGRREIIVPATCSVAHPIVTGSVTIRAHIASAAADPTPFKLELAVPCPHMVAEECRDAGPSDASADATSAVAPEAAIEAPADDHAAADAGSGSAQSHDAAAVDGGDRPRDPGEGSGCSCDMSGSGSDVGGSGAAAALILIALRRRSRRLACERADRLAPPSDAPDA